MGYPGNPLELESNRHPRNRISESSLFGGIDASPAIVLHRCRGFALRRQLLAVHSLCRLQSGVLRPLQVGVHLWVLPGLTDVRPVRRAGWVRTSYHRSGWTESGFGAGSRIDCVRGLSRRSWVQRFRRFLGSLILIAYAWASLLDFKKT